MKFDIIVADPPWRYRNNQNSDPARGAVPYESLSTEELNSLDISSIASDNSLLFLWATAPRLPEAIQFITGNGFEYCTIAFNWVKLNKNSDIKYIPNNKAMPDVLLDGGIYSGMGYYTNSQTELVLVGRKGKMLKRKNKSVKQLIFSPVTSHSSKPQQVNEKIELIYGNDVSYLELFARVPEKRIGNWSYVGNEVGPDYLDIREAILQIKNDTYF